MHVLHGAWVPETTAAFIRRGELFLWVETAEVHSPRGRHATPVHPRHLGQAELAAFLRETLGLEEAVTGARLKPSTCSLLLPSGSGDEGPWPSPELSRCSGDEPHQGAAALQRWEVTCCALRHPIKALSDIHFLAFYNAQDVQPGSDFLFWYYYTQSLKQLIYKDQYLPALLYREAATTGRRRKTAGFELYSGWRLASDSYEDLIARAVAWMPWACAAGAPAGANTLAFHDRETLLRHFSEQVLTDVLLATRWPAAFDKKVADTLLHDCLHTPPEKQPFALTTDLEPYLQWHGWRQQLSGAREESALQLCFQLHEAPADDTDDWRLEFVAASRQDPSLRLPLADYWALEVPARQALQKHFGRDMEKHLLVGLGRAARMYPKLQSALETDRPVGLPLTLEEAFAFLKEDAWILEDAGFKVIIPSWWTPQGRQRAKIRLRSASSAKGSAGTAPTSYLSLDGLIRYRYELAIGGQPVTAAEWRHLVDAKTPLVQFRGQWMELDRDKMRQMLAFWQEHGGEAPAMSIQDLLRKTAEEAETFDVDRDDALAHMMAALHDAGRLEPVDNPPALRATLRDYQKRGVAWLSFLQRLGLGGCLADDMGLGKTMQVIAQWLCDKTGASAPLCALLIAPTSVIGNWHKEIERFAPDLQVAVHHGPDRVQDPAAFAAQCRARDVTLTSYTLARKDESLLRGVAWRHVVLDEAQNIKNPAAAQTKAILKLNADHRLALTGTPVENRLTDLWSIVNFLNPGYLGKQAQFRKVFELPVQRDNDAVKTALLKRLVQPFILRRVKTDPHIIKDLPDKVEHKQYCNLSKEQASLYEAVVKDVEAQLAESEGIQRQGLMLSTLMRLKQICNHPMQFLQDGSAFTAERSHKLQRLTEMLEEVMDEGDSVLIFSQFTEIGDNLERYLRQRLHYQTYYLHGGTSRARREEMIAEFQDPQTGPAVFVLSLKAGGVGITLTKANHVFHFDRWWNPAVEDQATDRAFRIGQKKNVFVHKFVTLGTLEERIDQMIEDKKQVAGMIVGSDESWLARLDNQRFRELIALNKQAVMD